VIFLDNLK